MTHNPTPTTTNRPGISAHGGYGIREDYAAKKRAERILKASIILAACALSLAVAVNICGVCAERTHEVAQEVRR